LTVRGLALFLVAAIVACTMHAGPPPDSTLRGPALIAVRAGAAAPPTDRPVVFVELAVTPQERERGLGGRDRLAADHGMLFVYPHDEPRTFWMKDCLIGLDIAFLDVKGRVLNVATLGPGVDVEDAKLPRASSAAPSRFVLETASGWLGRRGIGQGDLVDLAPALEALRR
jgi:uncharacterized membrane protein (UPF0127 family)